jgi:hypothetical protein
MANVFLRYRYNNVRSIIEGDQIISLPSSPSIGDAKTYLVAALSLGSGSVEENSLFITDMENADLTASSGGTTLDILTHTASAGTTITEAGLAGKGIHAIIYNGLAITSGYTFAITTITFTDGTTFAGGESVKIIIY